MEINELDRKLLQIQKSTRTLFKFFSPWHHFLRNKNRVYYQWHLSPWAKPVHFGGLILYLFLVAGLILAAISPPAPKTQAASITLQPGGEGKDAWFQSFSSTTNWNHSEYNTWGDWVRVGQWTGAPASPEDPSHYRSIIQFDLSSIPQNSAISSATLQLYNCFGETYCTYLAPTITIGVYNLTSSWEEGTVNWSNQPSHSLGTLLDTASVAAAAGWVSFNVTPAVATWVAGSAPNYGLKLLQTDAPQGTRVFHSSDNTNRPKLTINYAPSSTSPPAPPSGNVYPLAISDIQVQNITSDSATITWRTSENSNSKVIYGAKSGSYPSSKSETNNVTSHSVTITGLNPDTKYYFKVKSKTSYGKEATSSEYSFTTTLVCAAPIASPVQPQPAPESSLTPAPVISAPAPVIPLIKPAEKAHKPLALLAALAMALALLIPLLANLPGAAPLGYLGSYLTLFLWTSRRRKPWGVVYDAETQKPIPKAIVQLFNKELKKLVETTTTDYQGRFGFLVDKGEYFIQVVKDGYSFPSKLAPQGYQGGIFKASEGLVNFNVPLDPQVESLAKRILNWQRLAAFLERVALMLLVLGTGLSVLVFFYAPDLVNLLILIVYLLLWVAELLKRRRVKSYGQVFDTERRGVIDLAILRLFDQGGRLRQTKVSNLRGRYFFLTNPGKFVLSALKSGFHLEKKELKIKKEELVAQDILLKKTEG